MKLSKILLTGAVMAAAMTAFVACAEEDDPNEMISGSGNSYTVDYTNESTTEISRGYKSTKLKHAGALVKMTFDASSDVGGGVMGVIFDLKDNAENAEAKDFSVVGVRTTASGAEYYISTYTGVTDLQGNNFGATVNAASGPSEKVIKAAFTAVPGAAVANRTVYVYFVETIAESEGAKAQYDVYFLPASVAETAQVKDTADGDLLDANDQPINLASYKAGTIATAYETIVQGKFAVYANAYASKTLIGTWDFLGTYKEAEVVEE